MAWRSDMRANALLADVPCVGCCEARLGDASLPGGEATAASDERDSCDCVAVVDADDRFPPNKDFRRRCLSFPPCCVSAAGGDVTGAAAVVLDGVAVEVAAMSGAVAAGVACRPPNDAPYGSSASTVPVPA